MRKICTYFLTLILFIPVSIFAKDRIRFIENKGQWNAPFLYKSPLPGGALFIEKQCFTYNFYNSNTYNLHNFKGTNKKLTFHAFKVNFLNANPNVEITGTESYPDYYNYFIGGDRKKWRSNIKAMKRIKYQEIYTGIDLHVYALNDFLKYDFIIRPEEDVTSIRLQYEGANITLDKTGNLHITTSVNEIVEQKPYAYQLIAGHKVEVPCEFVLDENVISFKILEEYVREIPLVIDPILIFASYSGSTADNFGMTATYGSDGSLFAGGTAFNVGYPTTTGALDSTFNGTPGTGITDVVISRYDSTGANLIYSTYIGGQQAETVHSLIANEKNELYLYGATSSLDFPVTKNAYDTTFNGGDFIAFPQNGTVFTNGSDIYVTKINPTGTALLGSTFVGGSKNDGINYTVTQVYDTLMKNYGDQYRGEIILDEEENCYIGSSTKSDDFPIINGFDSQLDGHQDGIVLKFSKNLENLFWSTYIGGSNADACFSIKADTNKYVYVAGGTNSVDFPATPGSIHTAFQGGKSDGYIAKIDSNGSSILASSYIGTSAYDQCYFIDLDRFGDVYSVGQTEGNFSVVNAAYSNANSGQFIAKYDNNLTTTNYSTIFGNGNTATNFSPSAFLVDRCQNVYVSGWGGSILGGGTPLTGMPISSDAFQSSSGDGHNFYLFVLERDAGSLLYGTYFGGNQSDEHVDGGTSRFDKDGIVYQSVCAGCGGNDDFPTTSDTWSNTNNSSNCNNGVFKFDFEIVPKAKIVVEFFQGCSPLTIQFFNESSNINNYLWDFGNGDTTSQILDPIKTFDTPGVYEVSLFITGSVCGVIDTAFQTIVVTSPVDTSVIFADEDTIIKGQGTFLRVTPEPGFSFDWGPNVSAEYQNSASPYVTPEETTTYIVEVTNLETNCSYPKTITIHVLELNCAEPDIFLPNAFTPNDDGENDVLYLRGNYITDMHLTIFDRWGEKVFETKDQSVGWDGKFKGELVEPAVFVYYLTAICADGQEYSKKGNVTVIR